MVNNKEELVKEDPLLAMVAFLNGKFQDEVNKTKAFLASQNAKKPENQRRSDDAKVLLEVAKFIEPILNRCIKKIKYDYLPQERFQLNFLYRATRNRILMSLPKPYAMTLNRMYNDLWKVNDRLRQIEEVKKEGRPTSGPLHLLYSLPSDIPKLRHLEGDLSSLLSKLQVQEYHQFKNQTDQLIKKFEKRLRELE